MHTGGPPGSLDSLWTSWYHCDMVQQTETSPLELVHSRDLSQNCAKNMQKNHAGQHAGPRPGYANQSRGAARGQKNPLHRHGERFRRGKSRGAARGTRTRAVSHANKLLERSARGSLRTENKILPNIVNPSEGYRILIHGMPEYM